LTAAQRRAAAGAPLSGRQRRGRLGTLYGPVVIG
jgi:hypothetical protein